jgi:peptidoglycan/LPS O-acetylase OafA/YrhL
MTGGYIGVDVFFVLSGYLISGIIIKQNLKNKFSFLDFYSRRVKRIYPALILVLIFVMFFGIMEFLPVQLKSLSKMVTASSFFYANLSIMNNRQSYFNPFTKTNPLLHLWSLGVE